MKTRTIAQWPARSISILIPFYNEEESIDQLHERLIPIIGELQAQARVQLILVDDGSTDRTFELLHERFGRELSCHCEILQHPENRGIGAAMRTGFKAATGEIVATLDSDCSYPPEELLGMIRMLRDTRADIVTASPYHPAVMDAEASRRLILSWACSRLYRWLIPEKLYCYTSFFRVYRREWTRADMSVSDGFLGVTEMLVSAAYCGAAIAEYPARLGTRRFGRSKMRTLQVIREHLGLMARTVWLNARLRLGGLMPEEPPLYAIAGGLEPQLARLDYVGREAPLAPEPAAVEEVTVGV